MCAIARCLRRSIMSGRVNAALDLIRAKVRLRKEKDATFSIVVWLGRVSHFAERIPRQYHDE